jgi:small subunit ribosomal protein S6
MRLYELMAIFPIEEALQNEGRERLQNDLATAGVVIEKTDEFGERDLAYEINKRKRAKYVLYTVRLDSGKITGLDRAFHLNTNLIRYLFVRIE